jgi:type IV secretion system protein VirB1
MVMLLLHRNVDAGRKAAPKPAAVALMFLGMISWGPVIAAPVSSEEFYRLASRCGPQVAPSTLISIAKVESRLQPLAINDNSTGTRDIPANLQIAIGAASALLKAGHSIDIGIMQINSVNLDRLAIAVDQAFDPCISIDAAAKILAADYVGGETREVQQAALRRAISRYNTGDPERGFLNGYVNKVELAARQVVPGLEAETPDQNASPGSVNQPNPDKNAPPSWDIWGSYEYGESPHGLNHPATIPMTASDATIGQAPKKSADGGEGILIQTKEQ